MGSHLSGTALLAVAIGSPALALGAQALKTGKGIKFLENTGSTRRSWIFVIGGVILCSIGLLIQLGK